ncbi:hypothetical protein CHISP_3272 [Chitinispirillum alkaliphilum]|nr:hypothetical protein CHISP_3272 [Chitinispirillum alkaliphilum]
MGIKQVMVCCWILLSSGYLFISTAQDTQEVRSEIDQYRSKIEEIRKKIDHTNQKAHQDSVAFAQYVTDHEERARRLSSETDSLSALIKRLNSTRDSLEARVAASDVQTGNYRAQSRNLLRAIGSNCKELIDSLGHLSMFNADNLVSALKFLEGEISAGSVGAVEALERYWQIVTQIENASQRIETWSGPAPVPSVQGDFTWLRIGFVWVGCVSNDGNTGYMWQNDTEEWVQIESLVQLSSISKAARLTSGMAAPELVSIPFNHLIRIAGEQEEAQ